MAHGREPDGAVGNFPLIAILDEPMPPSRDLKTGADKSVHAQFAIAADALIYTTPSSRDRS
jgi:hypothetical protein